MIRFLVLALISFSVMAAPGSIEVWFLSNAKVSEVQKLLDRPQYVYYKKTAEVECQEMGDFCFDPQFGLYKKGELDGEAVKDEEGKLETVKAPAIPSAKS